MFKTCFPEQTGSAPSDAEIFAASPAASSPSPSSATAAAAGRRNRIVQQIRNRMRRN